VHKPVLKRPKFTFSPNIITNIKIPKIIKKIIMITNSYLRSALQPAPQRSCLSNIPPHTHKTHTMTTQAFITSESISSVSNWN